MTGNHIHHLGRVYKHNAGITLQNGSGNNRVAWNIVHDVPRYGITMKPAGQRHIANFANNQTGCTLARNILAFSNPTAYLFAAPALTPETIVVDHNLYYCPGASE